MTMEVDTSRSVELGASDDAGRRDQTLLRDGHRRKFAPRELLRLIPAWLLLQLPWVLAWGFTVDDAWISARVAQHLAAGLGHRFNFAGPLQDAVTPLGWAHVLSLAPGSNPTDYVAAARWIGVFSWIVVSFGLALRWVRLNPAPQLNPRTPPNLRAPLNLTAAPHPTMCWWAVALPLATCLPLGAWISAGMETGLVISWATAGVVFPKLGPLALGWAAAWRPELTPWALLAVTAGFSRRDGLRRAGLLLLPVLAIALWRWSWFGRAVPLAFYAKPSDLLLGFGYALGALQFCVVPVLLVSTKLRQLSARGRRLLLAGAVHWVAMILAGGDWMSLFRLAVPILPATTLVAVELAAITALWATMIRALVATALSGLLLSTHLAATRGVWEQRAELIARAREVLRPPVGGVDIGWIGAACDGPVVDFAGVTDSGVAFLPGGHTSKALSSVFLSQRAVATWVVSADASGRPRYAVDARLLASSQANDFELVATLPLERSSLKYLIYQLKE